MDAIVLVHREVHVAKLRFQAFRPRFLLISSSASGKFTNTSKQRPCNQARYVARINKLLRRTSWECYFPELKQTLVAAPDGRCRVYRVPWVWNLHPLPVQAGERRTL